MNRSLKNMALLLLFLTFAMGCKKKDVSPQSRKIYGKLEVLKGDGQSGNFGDLLGDSIVLKASSNSVHRRYSIRYAVIQGNGDIETSLGVWLNNPVWIDSTGILKVNWRLGCDTSIQKVKFYLYVDSAQNQYRQYLFFKEPSDSVTLTASGTEARGWVRTAGYSGLDTYDTKIISHGKTLYLISFVLYRSDDNGLNWKQVTSLPAGYQVVDAQFNSRGWMYVLTENHGILFSKDQKQWQAINNGLLVTTYPISFLVEDTTLFVSHYLGDIYKTSDNGGFWKKLIVSSDYSERYYCIRRLPSGALYLFDEWNDIWVSKDSGTTWNKVSIDFKYKSSTLTDMETDSQGNLYLGCDNGAISMLDPQTYQGEVHKNTAWSGSVEDIQAVGDNVYYLETGNTQSGIFSKLNNWNMLDIGFNKRIYYYYLKSDNTFMVLSYDGLYLYNKN